MLRKTCAASVGRQPSIYQIEAAQAVPPKPQEMAELLKLLLPGVEAKCLLRKRLDNKFVNQPVGQIVLTRYFAAGFSARQLVNCTATRSPIGICGCLSGSDNIT